jgi:biotin carboxyl carrier protein
MSQHELLCPLPGTFYRRPAPDQPAFANEGDTIAAGAVIGLVEVMKQFSEVQSDVAGTVLKFLADNETPVEPGQPLALIETA